MGRDELVAPPKRNSPVFPPVIVILFHIDSSPWRSAHVISTMTLGLSLIVAFIVWQKVSKNPIIPRNLFDKNVRRRQNTINEQKNSILVLFVVGLSGATSSAVVTFFPLEARGIFGSDELYVARLLVPLGFAIPLGIILVNYGITYTHGAVRELFVLSNCFMVAGVAGLASLSANSPGRAMGLSFLGGLGVGGIVQPAATILTILVSDDFIATAVGLTLSIRLVGASVGYAIYFNVLQNLDGDMAFRTIYLVSIAFGGSAIVASLFLGSIKKYMVETVAVVIDEK
jgi:hypothetical protein